MQMRRTLPYMAALAAAALVGCAGTPTLYNWGPYEQQVYAHFKNESPVRQIELLEKHAQETQAKGKQLPPGYRAHLGLLYEKVGRGPDFVSALEQEKAAFPESASYIDKLLEQLKAKPAAPASATASATKSAPAPAAAASAAKPAPAATH